jgi:hypothetical protein
MIHSEHRAVGGVELLSLTMKLLKHGRNESAVLVKLWS